MALAISPNRSNASITLSSEASDKPGGARPVSTTDSNPSDTGEDTTLIRWIPIVVPLFALLPMLGAYFVGWGVLAGTH